MTDPNECKRHAWDGGVSCPACGLARMLADHDPACPVTSSHACWFHGSRAHQGNRCVHPAIERGPHITCIWESPEANPWNLVETAPNQCPLRVAQAQVLLSEHAAKPRKVLRGWELL